MPPRSGRTARSFRNARIASSLRRWIDSAEPVSPDEDADRIDWLRAIPFIAMHIACIGVIWVGVSRIALLVAALLYAMRMFALTGFYHRYFSHRAFRTSRAVQFVFAAIGAMCVQRGPLWWAAHHRHHHRHTDTPEDMHSPRQHGFLWAHMGWFLTPRGFRTNWEAIPDFRRFPELRLIDRFDLLMPVLLAASLYGFGSWLGETRPELGTSGAQMLVWGFFVSTIVLFHATVTINSLAHQFGSRRFDTRDDSRNNWILALLTFGEGWHNNHHHFPGAARQGFRWWEFDLTWYLLRGMAAVGLVRDLKPVPAAILAAHAARSA
ncbi:acyl-CoA desaturase [Dokdonella immobilis]|uniref:Delta-9 acyl-phospholipid desaturase n=1 Tax=Dokdonella immobilis TaxID=578942 RepID=A0A1I4WJ45_9GAMM|nr:fatty acid desaturase [Dokdonella immobilis]SFN13236.1 Delta-9 acyl-phospholipid desaturase [Dokdonella immobilis]